MEYTDKLETATTMQKTFVDAIAGFDIAMLVTRSGEGELRGRPMAIAEIDETGDMWFVTAADSAKIDEIQSDEQVAVVMQKEKTFVSLSGTAEIVVDRARLKALWKTEWDCWFAQNRDDPRAVLIHFASDRAEYWDRSGLKGVKHFFQAHAASPRGKMLDSMVEPDPKRHGKLHLPTPP
jgi:general stress protein 26